jgi:glycosyltransferase involved in cell wall biosynthesis
MPPEVSVVIPTCARADLMLRAVQSACDQTFRDLEIIVVVDGADEPTLDALAKVPDPRLRIIALQQKVGGSEARNIGARAASGQWIALLDDDDEWFPVKLDRQLAAARASQAIHPLVTSRYLVRATGKEDRVRPRRLPKPDESIPEYMFDYLCYFQTSTFFCSRELFLKTPFRKDLKSFQDIDWFLRVNSHPDVELTVVPETLGVYYAPVERPTITSKLSWKSRLAWGRENRHLMTRRAYSRFVAGSCAGRAVQDGAGLAGFRELFRECAFVGSPEVSALMLLFGTFLITPELRQRLRDLVFLSPFGKSLET